LDIFQPRALNGSSTFARYGLRTETKAAKEPPMKIFFLAASLIPATIAYSWFVEWALR
jgi:hypothetical protein